MNKIGHRSDAKHKLPQKTTRNNPLRWLIILVLILLTIVSGLACAQKPEPQSEEGVTTLDYGQSLYSKKCTSCHGEQGEGRIRLNAPALDSSEQVWQQSDEQIISLIRYGRGSMPAVGANLSDEEIEGIITYIKQWWTPEQRDSQIGNIGEN